MVKEEPKVEKKKQTPQDYDRWDGKIGIKVVSKPNEKPKKKDGKK